MLLYIGNLVPLCCDVVLVKLWGVESDLNSILSVTIHGVRLHSLFLAAKGTEGFLLELGAVSPELVQTTRAFIHCSCKNHAFNIFMKTCPNNTNISVVQERTSQTGIQEIYWNKSVNTCTYFVSNGTRTC